MGQVSAVLRNVEGGFSHWCPGCERMHVIPTRAPYSQHWSFDGNVEQPTFSPSVKITYNGRDAGQERDDDCERAPQACCHYFVRAGQIEFCGDSTHALAGKTAPLPPLPEHLRDAGAG